MFLAAFSSRSREHPHSQECQRWDRSFGTTRPQPEHSCVVPRAFTSTKATPALSALDRNVSRKLPQATSLIARASRSFLSMFLMPKLSTTMSPKRRTNFKAVWW